MVRARLCRCVIQRAAMIEQSFAGQGETKALVACDRGVTLQPRNEDIPQTGRRNVDASRSRAVLTLPTVGEC